ncbi:hypothetical protein [Bradyrhizobium lablabi]|uniref:hypothetical protein n=1 Tax=Bradyrhizobium lablabi TaxID=722472 RepID=UPI002011554E|nr:hypothetical protein [Bradyrhizobium lablabi]
MVALGLLIPLGVGVLSAMELNTPARTAAPAVQPAAETISIVQPVAKTNMGASDSQGVLAKADRLDVAVASNETSLRQMAAAISETPQQIAAASSETPEQPALVDEPASASEDIRIAPSEPPKPISRPRHDPKPKKAAAAARHKPKPKPAGIKTAGIKPAGIKTAGIKPTVVSQRSKAAANPEPCRLKAFGGLLKALNSTDCEI